MKKIIKYILFISILLILIILIKKNVRYTKANQNTTKESKINITYLNNDSELVNKLYDKLNMNLVNTSCTGEDKCLINDTFSYLYYNVDEKKELTDEEKIYFAINKLYKENKLNNINDNGEYIISIDDLKEAIQDLYGKTDFNTFNSEFRASGECGITNYTYTGSEYLIKINVCKSNDIQAKSIVNRAYKINNSVFLEIKAFKYNTNIETHTYDENIVDIYNFNNEIINRASLNHIENDSASIFKDENIDKYTFKFELEDDQYYLKEIYQGELN